MATDLERLVVQLSADITKYERSLNRALGLTNSNSSKMEKRFAAMNKNMSASIAGLAARTGVLLAGAFSVKGLSDLQDSYTKIQNSLKAAGLSGAGLTKVYGQLYKAAQDNAAPIESLAQLYSRVAINQKELGVSSDQIIKLSTTVAGALRLQGSSAEESSGALLQLSQALGSGKVQAEEYNSLIDGLPLVLRAAAAGIKQAGGSVAKLTQLVKSGQISSKALFDGIDAGSSVIADSLAGSTLTAGQNLIMLRNALTNAAGKFGEATGSAEKFSSVMGSIVGYLDHVSFDNFVAAINNVIAALDTGIARFQSFMQKAGEAAGLDTSSLSKMNFGSEQGDDGYSFLYGGGKERQAAQDAAAEDKAAAEERLSLEKQISALRTNPVGNTEVLRELQARRDALSSNKQKDELPFVTKPKPKQGPLNFQGPIKPEMGANPIDITDSKYKPVSTSKSGGKKSKADDYEREVKQIKERTAATAAETAAQAKLNPLIDDYGFAVAKARAAIDLENAAKEAGKAITPELAKQIDGLATAYANAEVAANRLDESQSKIKARAEEMTALQKDVTRGIVDGFIQGTSAAEIFSNALEKIGSKLLDLAFDDLFDSKSSGGLGGFGGLFKLLGGGSFDKGGYTGPGAKNKAAGVVHKGEYVVTKAMTDKIGVDNLEKLLGGYANGGLVGDAPRLPRMAPTTKAAGDVFNYAPVVDARGADSAALARLQVQMDKDRAAFETKAVRAIQKAKKSNVKGV